MNRVPLALCAGAGLALACQAQSRDDAMTAGGDGIGDAGSATASESGADGADGPGIWDIGGGETDDPNCVEGNCSEGCTGVDLLFVVDNSGSMNDYQVALGQAFPTFADAIIDVLPEGTNLHVAVTSTEMGYSGSGSTTNCTASGDGNQPAENFYLTPDVAPSATNGAQGRLYVAGGLPYFEIDTDAPQAQVDELKAWFAAASNIGEGGSNVEMAAGAAGWATDPVNDATNAGFIRDAGAVLVIFFIQDEPDQTPVSAAEDLVAKITAAKTECGGLNCVVGGGFVNEVCLPQVALGTVFDALPEPPVTQVLPPAAVGNPSPDLFEPLLRDTLATVIAEKCDEIPPVG